MKLNLLFIFLINLTVAQPVNNLFTLVTRTNTTSNTGPSQNKAGSININTGFVNDVSTTFSEQSFNVAGGDFDPIQSKMYLMTGNSTFTTFNFNTGGITTIPYTTSFSGTTYFDNVSYSHSNNTLYGLVRPFGANNVSLGVFFGKLNTTTGQVTTLSPNSIASGYQLAGTIIDPELMVYYFKTGPKFLGIDLYNGTIYSQPDIVYSSNDYDFSNFTYNCADNSIYGIVREMTTIQMPNAPSGVFIQHSRLGKIDPATGIVTRVSQTILPNLYYSVTAGATIDPSTNTFYCSDNTNLYGISTVTGIAVSTTPLVFENGNFVNFIANTNDCSGATASRLDPNLSNTTLDLKKNFNIYPNPVSSILTIQSEKSIDTIEVFDALGRLVLTKKSTNTLDVSSLQSGTYLMKIGSQNSIESIKFIKN
ncbi:MAG: T9SS type A sorting domain-containing protein [Flavobacterium sp.]|nr:T9SS type A sorting domain-containing protein [Flavobacterium sp.]